MIWRRLFLLDRNDEREIGNLIEFLSFCSLNTNTPSFFVCLFTLFPFFFSTSSSSGRFLVTKVERSRREGHLIARNITKSENCR